MGKVFVIGIDGADINLVKKWCQEGRLPAFKKLMDEGVYGHLKTTPNLNSASAWSSFMTGKNPGKHGVFHFYEKIPNGYNIRYINGSDCKAETIWSLLSKDKKKVGVINVPITFPAQEVNGFLISGMDAPGKASHGFTYPKNLMDELQNVVPNYVIEPGMGGYMSAGQIDFAIKKSYESVAARTTATTYLMDKYEWDFFMVVYREIDVVQHHFWKFMDHRHPEYDQTMASKWGDTIQSFYKKIDEIVGKLVSKLPNDCTVIILSDHGSRAATGGPLYINYFLRHIGFLDFAIKNHPLKGWIKSLANKVVKELLLLAQRNTKRETKEMLIKIFPRLREKVDTVKYFGGIDWTKTKIFSDGARHELWVNLKGREPQGVVEKGEEYEEMLRFLTKKLYQWCDPISKKRVVKKILRRDEIYHGPFLENAPDLLLIFEDNVFVSGIATYNDETGEFIIGKGHDRQFFNKNIGGVNGVHNDTGIFFIKGKGIKHGLELQGIDIKDIAPTILYIMDSHIPNDMDGRVIMDAFDDSVINGKLARYGNIKKRSEDRRVNTSGSYSPEESEEIAKRLRDLGYIK